MSSHTFTDALSVVLKEEGGFVDDSRDPGGATNLGVTARTWHSWSGQPASPDTMRTLTGTKVAPLYKAWFWDKVGGDNLPAALGLALFDFAVNAGPARAMTALQGIVGAHKDGQVGPATLRSIQAYISGIGLAKLIMRLCAARADAYQELPTFPVFGKGWLARIERIEAEALSWIG
ncbi:glycoside hydrolase family 108 protein [Novosphingobium acidiphilum]|jgi:lysozyme family protein|uniref:glycoside hydrolase family 108 protein n=1 Tax=Novosphingobium acidiphilum TaxID=505248 RepID=UPI0004008F1B|nr:glycosyl hydrolase 108 family protein [Novosphingobium acidiphilum]